jgi:hypothetical protein
MSKQTLETMSKAQARILIAKDVIAQLRCGKMESTPMTYLDIYTKDGVDQLFTDADVKKGRDVRDVLKRRMKKCNVCAKGAIFISTIMKFDRLPVDEKVMPRFAQQDDENLSEMASEGDYRGFFTPRQLDLLEHVYECGLVGDMFFEATTAQFEGRNALSKRFPRRVKDKERLIVMMQNVIDNNGTFKPEKFVGMWE